MKRTVREFSFPADLWAAVDPWAGAEGYRLVAPGDARRLYQKGRGVLVAPMMLELRRNGPSVHLEAWVRVNFFTRLMAFFIVPAEMGVESGGFRLALPRKMARTPVNKLLERLGQPAIP